MKLKKRLALVCLAVASSSLMGCGAESGDTSSAATPPDAPMTSASQATAVLGLLDGSSEADLLDSSKGRLLPEEAKQVLALRHGADGRPGTADDVRIESLDQIRHLPQSAAITEKMVTWAKELGLLEPGTTLEVSRGVLELDCESLDETARAEAVKDGLCPGKDGFVPYSLVRGSCGTSQFFILRKGPDSATFVMSLDSTRGTMLTVEYHVWWINYSKENRWKLLANSDFPVNSIWKRRVEVGTGSGQVCGRLSGTILLANLNNCRIKHPDDCRWI